MNRKEQEKTRGAEVVYFEYEEVTSEYNGDTEREEGLGARFDAGVAKFARAIVMGDVEYDDSGISYQVLQDPENPSQAIPVVSPARSPYGVGRHSRTGKEFIVGSGIVLSVKEEAA